MAAIDENASRLALSVFFIIARNTRRGARKMLHLQDNCWANEQKPLAGKHLRGFPKKLMASK
jgi:hypothetical protein